MDRYALLDKLYALNDGASAVITEKKVVPGDDFLIFSADKKITVTFHKTFVPYYFSFSNDEPIRVEDCPTPFIATFLKNVK